MYSNFQEIDFLCNESNKIESTAAQKQVACKSVHNLHPNESLHVASIIV